MNFSDLKECPYCGGNEFYTKDYVCGVLRYAERFDGTEADNTEMYDYLNMKEGAGRAYCRSCEKYLGNKTTNVIGKAVERIIKKQT